MCSCKKDFSQCRAGSSAMRNSVKGHRLDLYRTLEYHTTLFSSSVIQYRSHTVQHASSDKLAEAQFVSFMVEVSVGTFCSTLRRMKLSFLMSSFQLIILSRFLISSVTKSEAHISTRRRESVTCFHVAPIQIKISIISYSFYFISF